jgi:hypothetical protein
MSIASEYLPTLRKYKENSGCYDCGNFFPHYVLEFDHKPGYKKVDNVYRVLKRYGIDACWIEISKCDVVCANCHKIRTHDREYNDTMVS